MARDRSAYISMLQRIEIFEGLTAYFLGHLLDRAEVKTFAEGTTIIQKGEQGDCMYILVEGQVHIPIKDAAGKLQYTTELGPGQLFGEMALLTGHPRNSDVFAASDCECLCLAKRIVEHLMRTYPDIAQLLTAILIERVNRAGTPQTVGKYALLSELARGSMAVVYEGFHSELERPLAIKMLHHELVYQPQFAERFRNEAKIVAHLRHPNIVEVFDLEEAYATFFIIMEKVKGIELQHALQTQGSLPFAETRRILHQLLSALAFAHSRGVIHRDLKPSNIMIENTGKVKLMDFGIALLPMNRERPDEKEMLLGTPHFMSPEQHKCEPIDHRADLYALGITVYYMLTGRLPFHGNVSMIESQKYKRKFINIRKEIPDIPDDLEALVRTTTARHAKDRPASAQALLDLLEPIDDASGYTMSQLATQTLTLVHPPQQQQAVRALLEKYRKRAASLPHVIAHIK